MISHINTVLDSDTCTLVCQNRGVLDSAKCECACLVDSRAPPVTSVSVFVCQVQPTEALPHSTVDNCCVIRLRIDLF